MTDTQDTVTQSMQHEGGGAVQEKLEFNRHRPDHKLENRIAEGGKAY